MTSKSFTLFDTVLGKCGIAWRETAHSDGNLLVIGFQLPEETVQLTEARLVGKTKARKVLVIPPRIKDIIKCIKLHFNGEVQNLQDVELDLSGINRFARQVYVVARTIPAGSTLTYGQLARATGHPGAARAVGQALGRNPIPLLIPCHRILAANNKPGGFSAHGGVKTKIKMLKIEGIAVSELPK